MRSQLASHNFSESSAIPSARFVHAQKDFFSSLLVYEAHSLSRIPVFPVPATEGAGCKYLLHAGNERALSSRPFPSCRRGRNCPDPAGGDTQQRAFLALHFIST